MESPGSAAAQPASAVSSSQAATEENLVTFDPGAAEVSWADHRWQLTAGGVWLKDFRREGDAREAVRIIRELGLNQRGTVGTPRPVMEYWLAGGQAPHGYAFGLHLQPMDPGSLRVEEVQGQWIIRDAHRLFFVFGSHQDEARQALRIIQDHGFTQIGYVGQPVPELIYFVGGPTGYSASRMPNPRQLASRRSPSPPREAAPPDGNMNPPELSAGPQSPNSVSPVNTAQLQRARQLATVAALVNERPAFGDRVAIDPRQLKVQQDGQDWHLVCGEHMLANFGPYSADARRALHILQYYRCNEQCLVGQPRPTFSFFLSNGEAPRGTMFGLGGTPFRPDALVIRQGPGGWCICEREQPLINFGDKIDDARSLLQIIRQQHFNHFCRIGPEPYGMTMLLRMR
jgi:hypothetical protein